MANKKSEIKPLKETVKNLSTRVQDMNDAALKTTDSAVEATIEAGKEWQALMVKGLKGGNKLASKQQDIIFKTLESLKGQVLTSADRFNKIFNFDFSPVETLADLPGAKAFQKATKEVINQAETAKVVATSVVKEATKTATKRAKTAKTMAEEATKTVAKKATATKKAKTPVAKVTKETVKTVKTTPAAKTTTVKKTVKTPTSKTTTIGTTTVKNNKKDDLKRVDGIGPKIERLLNIAGIKTLEQLATAKEADLKAVLVEAGPRFKMHNPADWSKQAKTLAADLKK